MPLSEENSAFLGQFRANQVKFTIGEIDPLTSTGTAVVVTTPGGSVTLNDQVRYNYLTNPGFNVEQIQFADRTLDEESIRFRAIDDQATSGNDTVFGTAFADYVLGWGGDDVLYGGTGDDDLTGDYDVAGSDRLFGGDGNDILNGGGGADILDGGEGNDKYYVDDVGDVVIENKLSGYDSVIASIDYVLPDNVQALSLAGEATTGTGNSLANEIFGYEGSQSLLGGGGNDLLDGGGGEDILKGQDGDDTYIYNVGDVIVEASGRGTDLVISSTDYTLPYQIENLTLNGWEAVGTGNSRDNVLTTSEAGNTLIGLGGDDTLVSNLGTDTLDGGIGNDTYILDPYSNDVIIEASGSGSDLVKTSTSYNLASQIYVENVTLTGADAANATGNVFSNVLTGNRGDNTLSGLAGADTLTGGEGNDTLSGGTNADRFVFTAGSNGTDTIADFNQLDGGGIEGDVLVFDGLLVGSFAYLGEGGFSGGSDSSEARVFGNQLLVDADGDGASDIAVNLAGLTEADQLSADSFAWTSADVSAISTAEGAGLDTIAVRVRGDAYQGNPNFALIVNDSVVATSTVVGGDRTESELDNWDTKVFRGDFDLDGTDRIGIQFTNDAYTPGFGDRNLYVDSVTVNGEVNGQDQSFFTAGTSYWDFI